MSRQTSSDAPEEEEKNEYRLEMDGEVVGRYSNSVLANAVRRRLQRANPDSKITIHGEDAIVSTWSVRKKHDNFINVIGDKRRKP